MIFEVEDGKVVGVRGNKEHPMTRGGLCVKLDDYEKRHNHPDRVLYPLRRTGPKGSKQFERITWDEALDEITDKWKAIIDEYGPQAIIPNSYLGHQGLVHGLNGGDAFFNRLGATVCERTFCGEGSCTAWLLTVGPTAGVDPESYIHSKYIVLWACNSVSTNLHHWHIVHDAQKKGAKVVVIDAADLVVAPGFIDPHTHCEAQIKALLGEAIDAGAFGFSTTILSQHLGFQGRPLACRNARRDELTAYASSLKERGKGAIEVALTRRIAMMDDEEHDLLALLLRESGGPLP